MTPINLIFSLAAELREATKDYKLLAERQADKKISVYEQYIPTANFESDTFYPLILVQLRSVEDDGENSTATVVITIGTYGGENLSGWRDMLNIAERIRQYLLTHPMIGEKFQYIGPIAFEPVIGLENPTTGRPEPFSFGNIAVRYRIGTPRLEVEGVL